MHAFICREHALFIYILWAISCLHNFSFFQLSFKHVLSCFNGCKSTNKNMPKYVTDAEVNISGNSWIRETDPKLSSSSSQSLDFFHLFTQCLLMTCWLWLCISSLTIFFFSSPHRHFWKSVTILEWPLNPAKCTKQCRVVAVKTASLCIANIFTSASF